MQRLYNYFTDWFDDKVPPSDFSEMWDFVKKMKSGINNMTEKQYYEKEYGEKYFIFLTMKS